jgi:hypothetical protein
MKYKLVVKGNPRNPEVAGKWYANPVNAGRLNIKDFAKEIAGRSFSYSIIQLFDSTEFTADQIKGAKVIFTPGADLKESLKKIKYEQVK